MLCLIIWFVNLKLLDTDKINELFGLVQKNSKEKFEVVNRRRTDNTIAKGKGQTMIYKTLHRKLAPLNTGGELMCFGRLSSSCLTSDTRRVTLVTNPVINYWLGKGSEYDYNKRNISVVICDTDIP